MSKGKRIKKLREKAGFSQVELADKIGVSKQTLYKYENNIVTNIPSDKIELIAELTHSTPGYIMGWDDEDTLQVDGQGAYYTDPETARIAQALHDHPELSVMFDAYSNLDPKDAQLVLDMIKRMSND